jgi:uncharacterized protein YndB with AHSA1/START domain
VPSAATRIEQSITIRASRERVFALLTDPNYMPHYTTGIEAAEILEPGPDGGLVGARLELGTATGTTLLATVKELVPGERLEIEDDNGITSTWTVEGLADGRVRLRNTLVGNISAAHADRLRYGAEVKFQSIAQMLEREDDPTAPSTVTGGMGRITGTERAPRT